MIVVRRYCNTFSAIPSILVSCFENRPGNVSIGGMFDIVVQESAVEVGVCSVPVDSGRSSEGLCRNAVSGQRTKTTERRLTRGKIQDNAMMSA